MTAVALQWLGTQCGVSATPPTLSVCAAAKWIGAQKSGAKPSSAFDEAQTAQWIALGASAAEIGAFRTMGIIEESVRSRSYLVGTAVSVADYWVFYNVRALWTATAAPQLAKYFPCASRWVMHVAALCTAPLPEGVALPTPPPMGAALAQFKLADFEVKAPAVPAPAAGDALLFSGVADVEGFRHVDLDAYPAQRLSGGVAAYVPTQSTSGLSVCAANASFVARAHGDEPYDERGHGVGAIGALSRDNGVTWAPFGRGVNASGGYVHFVADPTCAQLLYLPFGAAAVPLVSNDWGATWSASVGAPRGVSGGATQWEGCECHRVACEAAPRDGGTAGLCYSYAPLPAPSPERGARTAAGRGVVSIGTDGGAAWSNSSAALPLPSAGVPGVSVFYVPLHFT